MIQTDYVLDAKGLSCPLPIVKTKKALNKLEPGQVLEIQATDKGSLADLRTWAERTGHQYLGTKEEGTVLRHYVRKAGTETDEEKKFPHVIDNDELQKRLQTGEKLTVIDVREPAEYAFSHIPGAISIPLGELDARMEELEQDAAFYIICRTGNRSDLAARRLSERGFVHVTNVVPGMSAWTGPTTQQ
mgnify:CR=1 FL=1